MIDAPYMHDPLNTMNPPSGVDRDVKCEIAGQLVTRKESQLLRLEGGMENDHEAVRWVQYHLPESGLLVHRGAHVHLKTAAVFAEGIAAALG